MGIPTRTDTRRGAAGENNMTEKRKIPAGRTGQRGIYTGAGFQKPEGSGSSAKDTDRGAETRKQEAVPEEQTRKYRPGQWSEAEAAQGGQQNEMKTNQAGQQNEMKTNQAGQQSEAKADPPEKQNGAGAYRPGQWSEAGVDVEKLRRTAAGRRTKQAGDPESADTQGMSVLEKIRERRRRKVRRALLAVFSVLALAYAGVAVYFGFHFYNETMIYGIDCSYKTVEKVKEEVESKLGAYVLEVQERDNRTETISAGQIGLTFTDNGSIDRMMKAQRSYIWPVMILMERERADSVAFSFDRAKAEQAVESLNCMDSGQSIAPRDAYVGITDTGYEVVKEVMGTTLDHDRTVQEVLAALDDGDVSVSLDERDCYVNPEIYEDNEELQHDAAAMSELAAASITYDFGDRQEVVDVSVIDGWIVKLADGTFTIDETKVSEYVENLAARYDTFGLTRQFYTSLGTVETLTGGDYGWCMDQDATMRDLMKALDDGYQGEMEPEYIYTAMSRDTNDIGYTYVEVCISQQRMWCYQDGNLIVDTPVVTGNPNKGNGTPSGGVWAIDAKMRDYVLKGEGYTAPVDYWMPFNDDVGIHDMQARAVFGGSIYLSNGSHGCVNTPYEQAKTIYSVVSIGTPVIVYE